MRLLTRISSWSAATLITLLGVGAGSHQIAQAVRLSDGKVYFVQPPSLVGASATQIQTTVSGSIYYFTLTVPANAGEPLGQVAIAERDSGTAVRDISYRLDRTQAFSGSRHDRGSELPVKQTTFDPQTQTTTVVFDPPVSPGTTVTIALRPHRNPIMDGWYLFGVTAYPAGDNPYGQFLGYGRIQFVSPSRDLFFP
jgi:hypothetical protein